MHEIANEKEDKRKFDAHRRRAYAQLATNQAKFNWLRQSMSENVIEEDYFGRLVDHNGELKCEKDVLLDLQMEAEGIEGWLLRTAADVRHDELGITWQ